MKLHLRRREARAAVAPGEPAGRVRIALILGGLTAFGPLSLDMYLPQPPGAGQGPGRQRGPGTALERFHRVDDQPVREQADGERQQMRWTLRDAHLLLQVRTRVLNDELADVFRRWYPEFDRRGNEEELAA
jgi:hypothetical protein